MPSLALDADVIVVGGAIAGAALGNALGRRGIRTIIIEKVSREIHHSRGDVLQPPTLEIIDGWGLLDRLHEVGTQPLRETRIVHGTRGLLGRFVIAPANDGPAGTTVALPHDRIEAVLYEGALNHATVTELRGTVTGLERDDTGRVCGVRWRPRGEDAEAMLLARLVVGCDGTRSLVRRELGIAAEPTPYAQDIIVIAGRGNDPDDHAITWYFDDEGLLSLVPRPFGGFRFLWLVPAGKAPAVLREPDPALHDYLAGRFPEVARLDFGREDASIYKVARHVAEAFGRDGAAIAGDAAHATNPAGGSGMNLAMTDAEVLAAAVAPVLLSGGDDVSLDAALAAYDEERRAASARSVMVNDERALAPYANEIYKDPDAFLAMWSRGGRRPTAGAALPAGEVRPG